MCVPCVMPVCGVSQRARSTAPTVLAREMHRFGLRPHAAPWGHFASLVRSIASQSARLPAVRRRRISPQSLDCVRVRSLPGPAHFASLRSAKGGGGPRGWHGRAAVFGAPPLRHRESAFIREGQSIRRYGALGLVAMPPCANRIRPGGVLPLAASDSLWPRGRHAAPLARYRHMSVSAARVPRALL